MAREIATLLVDRSLLWNGTLQIPCFYSSAILFQIRDKEKSNGQLREELGGVLEKNKNIMEEVDNSQRVSNSEYFSVSFSLFMYLQGAQSRRYIELFWPRAKLPLN